MSGMSIVSNTGYLAVRSLPSGDEKPTESVEGRMAVVQPEGDARGDTQGRLRQRLEHHLADALGATSRARHAQDAGKLDTRMIDEVETSLAALEHALHSQYKHDEAKRHERRQVLLADIGQIIEDTRRQGEGGDNAGRLAALRSVLDALEQQADQDAPENEGSIGTTSSEDPPDPPPSFADMLNALKRLAGDVRSGYLDVYAELVKRYGAFFSEFNREIMSKLGDWVDDAGDAGKVKLDAAEMKAALEELIQKYSPPSPDSVLYPPIGGSNEEDARRWLAAMGLPESCLHKLPNGTFQVVIDVQPLKTMLGSLHPDWIKAGSVKLITSEFQAWQNGFNAQVSELDSALQRHSHKYSNANSIHDNLQKTISSTYSSLFDMLKAIAAALGV